MYAPFFYQSQDSLTQNLAFVPYGDQTREDIREVMQQGIYTDWNASWFSDIGNLIVTSYLIIAILPVVEFIVLFLFRCTLRSYD